MTIDPMLCLGLFIRPACAALAAALDEPRLHTTASHALLWRTAAAESGFRHRRQLFGSPPRPFGVARGYPQIEPATLADIARWLKAKGGRHEALRQAMGYKIPDRNFLAARCEHDQFLAFGACRLKYWMVPEALPIAGDVHGQARYWKRWYNTEAGAGTAKHFMAAHEQHLAGLERDMGWIN